MTRRKLLRTTAFALGGLGALLLAAWVGGSLLPESHVATSRGRYHQDPHALWEAITDFELAPSWRPDLVAVERLPDRDGRPVWREIGEHGAYPVEILEASPPDRVVLVVRNPALPYHGNWTFEIARSGEAATLTITENAVVRDPILRFVGRFVSGHHATLDRYLVALGQHFGETTLPEHLR